MVRIWFNMISATNLNQMPKENMFISVVAIIWTKFVKITCIAKYENASTYVIERFWHILSFYPLQNNCPPFDKSKPQVYMGGRGELVYLHWYLSTYCAKPLRANN
jgi:hypothetical protein